MGKKSVKSAPVLTIVPNVEVKAKREPKFEIITVRVVKGISFDVVAGVLAGAAKLDIPRSAKTLKSGRVTVTIGKVTTGRRKLTVEEKAAKSAERAKVNATAKSLRKLMRTNKSVANFAEKLAAGAKLTDSEKAELIALVS